MADATLALGGGEEFSYENSSVCENSSYEEFSSAPGCTHG